MFSFADAYANVRAQYSSLTSMSKADEIFFENAGGSQIPDVVIDAMCLYMKQCYVQLGAGYSRSDQATQTVTDARAFVLSSLFNGDGLGDVIFGSNTSQMMNMLAQVYAKILQPGDEIGMNNTQGRMCCPISHTRTTQILAYFSPMTCALHVSIYFTRGKRNERKGRERKEELGSVQNDGREVHIMVVVCVGGGGGGGGGVQNNGERGAPPT
jgi:hypothetical protein